MKRSELIAQIKDARQSIRAKANEIQTQIDAGNLPASAQGTFFKKTVDYWKSQPTKNNYLKMGISRLNKTKLQKLLKTLDTVNNAPTSTVKGVKNRLEEEYESTISVLVDNGFNDDDARSFSDADLTYIFRIIDLIEELYAVHSDVSIPAAHEIVATESENYAAIKDIFYAMKGGKLESEERIVKKWIDITPRRKRKQ